MSPSANKMATALLAWYDDNKRPMPWRTEPTPYRVWISEIMSQQTRIETVMGYFERFMKAFPTIESLAFASLDDVLKEWQGLGYYSRARNIHKAAQVVVHERNGVFPTNVETLLTLPGVGPYTAGAIASIAFQQAAPAIDGNVLRVIARVEGIKESIQSPKVIKDITSVVTKEMSSTRPGDFNQALMEIGALVCIPNGAPKCEVCPLAYRCFAKKHHLMDAIPPKKKKTLQKVEARTVVVIEYQGKIGIRKREDSGLLASMYELFHVEGHFDAKDMAEQFQLESIHSLIPHTHVFSHLIWQMIGYHIVVDQPVEGLMFVSLKEAQTTYAIPNAFWPFLEQLT
jgi:A/G-specific adenine glycosylase